MLVTTLRMLVRLLLLQPLAGIQPRHETATLDAAHLSVPLGVLAMGNNQAPMDLAQKVTPDSY